MADSPLISVVMPVYNARAYVGMAIDSILQQTCGDFEFIIVDDASSDGSGAVVRQFTDPRIKFLQHSQNGGYPVAMNTGLTAARGKYIARMDADDWSAPERLETQVRFLDNHPGMVFVGTRRFWITPHLRMWADGKAFGPEWVEEDWNTVYSGSRHFADASVMTRRDLVDTVGRYRTYQRSGQDVDLWLRLLEQRNHAATLTQPLFGRRLRPDAITFAQGTTAVNRIPRILADQRREAGADAVMDGRGITGLVNETALTNSTQWRVRALWGAAQICLSARDYRSSVNFILAALSAAPLSGLTLRSGAKFMLSTGRHVAGRREGVPESLPYSFSTAGSKL